MKTITASILLIFLTTVRATNYLEVSGTAERIYTYRNETCCDGKIYEDFSSNDYECCGGKIINVHEEICCFPFAYPRLYHKKCCGGRYYSTLDYECHRVSTKIKTKTVEETSMREAVLPYEVNDTVATCGDVIIDLDLQICCNYIVVPSVGQYLECCGSVGYDPDSQVCCDPKGEATVVAKDDEKDDKCCDGKPYQSEHQLCVDGVVVDKETGKEEVCHEKLAYTTNDQLCCGPPDEPRVITKSKENDNRCCGDTSYNPADSRCCTIGFGVTGEYKLHARTHGDHKDCCGLEVYDTDVFCCGGQYVYNPDNQTCCEVVYADLRIEAQVHDGAKRKCCGTDVVERGVEQCCGRTKTIKPPHGQFGCCLYTIRDPTTEPEILRTFTGHARYRIEE